MIEVCRCGCHRDKSLRTLSYGVEMRSPRDVTKGESVGHRVLRDQAKELEVLRSPRKSSPCDRKKAKIVWHSHIPIEKMVSRGAWGSGLLCLTRGRQNTEYYIFCWSIYLFLLQL